MVQQQQNDPTQGPAPPQEPNVQGDEPLYEGEEVPPSGVRTMGILRWALVGLMAVTAAAAWVFTSGATERTSQAAVQYHCPMHPAVVAEHPGACPICGMDLVEIRSATGIATSSPRPWSAAPQSGVPGLVPIDLPPERLQLIGMRTAPVTRERLSPTVRTVGIVTAPESGIALVTTRFSGWIEELLVTQSGQYVKRGQVLARITNPDLLTLQQTYLNAVRWLDDRLAEQDAASVALERDARARLLLAGMSREDVDELARMREPLRAFSIRSPVNGYVGRKTAVTGLYAPQGTELFEIADLSTVWVLADVYESEIDRVRLGQQATISVPALPGQTFAGRVSFLYPAVSTGSRTLQARLEFRNPGLKLRPGLFANVTLNLGSVEGLVVPAEAVVDTGEYQYLFVAREGGRFEPRQVRLGAHGEGKVQILQGVADGETVVTTANFLIDSESRLRAAISGFGEGRVPSPHHTPVHVRMRGKHEAREAPAHGAADGVGAATGEDAAPQPGDGKR